MDFAGSAKTTQTTPAKSPPLLAMGLCAFGNWLFSSGGSLHQLRPALLAAQRKFCTLKPHAALVWELVSRREK